MARILLTVLFAAWLSARCDGILSKAGDSRDQSNKLKDDMEEEPSLERSSVYTGATHSSHHQPGYQAQASSYGFGYASSGGGGGSALGGGLGGSSGLGGLGGGHGGGGLSSLGGLGGLGGGHSGGSSLSGLGGGSGGLGGLGGGASGLGGIGGGGLGGLGGGGLGGLGGGSSGLGGLGGSGLGGLGGGGLGGLGSSGLGGLGGGHGYSGSEGGSFGVSGYGGEPIPSSRYHHHHHDHHVDHHVKHHQHPNPKALALKGLLVPLAGVALLGAAAALVSNPILLQLGVISGKRRRRDAADTSLVQQKLSEIALLERYMTAASKEQAVVQEKQLLANYLSCTGIASPGNSSSAACLERLTCELHHPHTEASDLEKHVMEIVTSEILTNEFVPEEVKRRVKSAAKIGAESGNCAQYPCADLEG